jgi:hypothetical protein
MKHLKSIKVFESVDVVDTIFSKIKAIKDTDVYEVKKDKHRDDIKLRKLPKDMNKIDYLINNIESMFDDLVVDKYIITTYEIQYLHFKILKKNKKSIRVKIYELQDEYYYITINKTSSDYLAEEGSYFVCDQFYGLFEFLKCVKKILDQA